MCGSMVDVQSATAENMRGKKKNRRQKKPQDKNIMSASAMQGGHKQLLGLLICVCALHRAPPLHTILHRTDLIIFRLTLQTIIIAPMMST